MYSEYCDRDLDVGREELVLDVGAWVKRFTVPVALKVGEGWKVVVVESPPTDLFFLKCKVSKLRNVRMVEEALGKRERRMRLFLGPSSLQHSLITGRGEHLSKGEGYCWVPDEGDMIHYAELLYLCDVAVNIASSVSLDSVILNKPTFNIAFEGYGERPFIESTRGYFYTTYYKVVANSGGVKIAKNPRACRVHKCASGESRAKQERKKEDYRGKRGRLMGNVERESRLF
ncbi:MAG: hypothetical protein QXG22_01435 [Candidatus Hadarchaeales archaeon]